MTDFVKSLINDVSSVEIYDAIDDLAALVGIFLALPSLQAHQDEIPPIVHLELWLPDLADLLESIQKEWDHYDWTV